MVTATSVSAGPSFCTGVLDHPDDVWGRNLHKRCRPEREGRDAGAAPRAAPHCELKHGVPGHSSAHLASREGTPSQRCPEQTNQPGGCTASSPSRRDRARVPEEGVISPCVLGGGLLAGGDATRFTQDGRPCSGGANASAGRPGVRKSRGDLPPPPSISSCPKARVSQKPDLHPWILRLPKLLGFICRCHSPAQRLGQQSPAPGWSCSPGAEPRLDSGPGDSRGHACPSSSSSSPPALSVAAES